MAPIDFPPGLKPSEEELAILERLLRNCGYPAATDWGRALLQRCQIGPRVPDGFVPANPAAWLYGGQVWTGPTSYPQLIRACEMSDQHKSVSRGLGVVRRCWQPFGLQKRFLYNLTVIQFVAGRPGFADWMTGQREVKSGTLANLNSFLEGLERVGVFPLM